MAVAGAMSMKPRAMSVSVTHWLASTVLPLRNSNNMPVWVACPAVVYQRASPSAGRSASLIGNRKRKVGKGLLVMPSALDMPVSLFITPSVTKPMGRGASVACRSTVMFSAWLTRPKWPSLSTATTRMLCSPAPSVRLWLKAPVLALASTLVASNSVSWIRPSPFASLNTHKRAPAAVTPLMVKLVLLVMLSVLDLPLSPLLMRRSNGAAGSIDDAKGVAATAAFMRYTLVALAAAGVWVTCMLASCQLL